MTKIAPILDFIALFVQIGGTYIMYKNSPENLPNGTFIYHSSEIDLDAPKQKNKKFKNGFKILGIGFIIQLISMIMKLF